MVDRQRPRRLCRRDHRRQPDQALSRPADRADRLAARAAADPRQSGRNCFRGRSVLAAVHQPLEQRRHRAGGSCPHRQLSSRLFRPGMELRGRGPSDRGADLDGARRPHHLCRVAVAAGGGYSRERPVVAADAARQRSRPSRHDLGRRFCARHSRGRRTSPAHRCGTFLADHSSARRHHRRQARLVSGFRAADGGRARPELDRQPSLHRRGDDTAGAWKVARHRCRARTGAVAPTSRPRCADASITTARRYPPRRAAVRPCDGRPAGSHGSPSPPTPSCLHDRFRAFPTASRSSRAIRGSAIGAETP